MRVRPYPEQTVGDVKWFAARSFNYRFGAEIRARHWHMETPAGLRPEADTPVWQAFERRGDVYLRRHEADSPY